jgi:hypothetical protein
MRRSVFVQGLAGLTVVGAAVTSAFGGTLQPGDLIVTEIMNNPFVVSDADGEWFEIFNASSSTVDLRGLEIRDDGSDSHVIAGLDPVNIAPGQYFVLGINDNPLFNGGATVDYEYPSGFALANGGDEIEIVDGATVIDRVAWDGGPSFPDLNGASMSLNPEFLNAADNDLGFNWCESTSALSGGDLGTPGATNDACNLDPDVDDDGIDNESDNCPSVPNPDQEDCDQDGIGDICTLADGLEFDCNNNNLPDNCDILDGTSLDVNPANGIPDECEGPPVSNALPGDLVITEIMNNPFIVLDDVGEWFEIKNVSGGNIELAGLTITDNNGVLQLPNAPSITVASGDYFVFARNGDTAVNGGVDADYVYGEAIQLNNSSDGITITKGMVVIDRVAYDDGATFPDPSGASMNLDPDRTDATLNDLGVNWCEGITPFGLGDLGTPGADNDSCDLGDDTDMDGIPDSIDNCVDIPNTDQADCDLDGEGDVCEIDVDPMNGVPDDCETGWVVNEILFFLPNGPDGDANNDGSTDFNDDEFVEIVNNTGGAINISGWTLSDGFGERHIFPPGTIVENECAVVVFGGGVPIGGFGGVVVQTASTGMLGFSSGGDTVALANQGGVVVASATYGPPLTTDVQNSGGESIVRDPDIIGTTFVRHSIATGSGGALYSAGIQTTGFNFGGCPPPLDTDMDGVFDLNDNCPNDSNPDQADCDNDGVGDVCAISGGLANDCNSDGVPDNCEVISGTAGDCNQNGIPDDCDFTTGLLTDGNEDGFPDQCVVVPPANLQISEIRIAMPAADDNEYFELVADPGAPLIGVRYVVIGDGDPVDGSGVIEAIVNLDGTSVGFDGNFVVAEDTFTLDLLAVDLTLPSATNGLNFEDSDNVTHVLVANFFGTLGQDLDTDDDGVLDVTPWLTEIDRVALVEEPNPPASTEYHYGLAPDQLVGPDGIFVPGHVYRCTTAGTWTIGDFDPASLDAADTPGAVNAGCIGDTCPWDIDGDNTVGFSDLTTLLGNWGPCVGCPADFDMDNTVGFSDLTALLGNWGICP